MTQEKHTPGPWRVFGRMTGKVISENGPGMVEICETGDFRDAELVPFNAERWNADARLIAAAPDMLEALRDVVSDLFLQIESRRGPKAASQYPSIVAARAAIARATGEKP